MSKTQHVRAGWLLGALGACLLVAGTAGADVSTERPGSILIFPKVVNDGTRQTVIQVANTSNSTAQARCFYLAGQAGPTGAPLCSETDFNLSLTKQQPTHWNVGDGRGPFSGLGGLLPGLVPPVPVGFTGALICVQVDPGGAPVAGNALKGEATLFGGISRLDTTKYNGIAVVGIANSTDNTLALNNAEYNACPAGTRVNFVNPGAVDPGVKSLGNWGICDVGGEVCSASPCNETGACYEGQCQGIGAAGEPCNIATGCAAGTCVPYASVTTSVTVLPCNLDFNALVPTTVVLSLEGTDGLELPFSGSKTVTCWGSFVLDSPIIARPTTDFATVEIVSQSGGPVLAVVEALHTDANVNVSTADLNTHIEVGTCDSGLNVGKACSVASDCPLAVGGNGVCVAPTAAIRLPAN